MEDVKNIETGRLYWVYWSKMDHWFIAMCKYSKRKYDYEFLNIFGGFNFWYTEKEEEGLVIVEEIRKPIHLINNDSAMTKKERWMLDWLKAKFAIDPTMMWSPTTIGHEYGKAIGKPHLHSSSASPVLKKLADQGLVERNIKEGKYRYKPSEKID